MSGQNDKSNEEAAVPEDIHRETADTPSVADRVKSDANRRAISEASLAGTLDLDLWSDVTSESEPGAPEGPLKIGDSDEAHHATSEALARFLADRYDSELPSSLFPRGVDRTSPLTPVRPELDAPQRFEGALARVQSGAVSAIQREPSLLTVPLDAEDLGGILSASAWDPADDDDWGDDEPGQALPEGVPQPFGPGELTTKMPAAPFADLPGARDPADLASRMHATRMPPVKRPGQTGGSEPLPPIETDRLGLAAPERRAPIEPAQRDPDAPQWNRRTAAAAFGPGGFGRGLTQPYAVDDPLPEVPEPPTTGAADAPEPVEGAPLPPPAAPLDVAAPPSPRLAAGDIPPPTLESDEAEALAERVHGQPLESGPLPQERTADMAAEGPTIEEPPPRSRWRSGLLLGLAGAAAATLVIVLGSPRSNDPPPATAEVSAAQTTPPLWPPPEATADAAPSVAAPPPPGTSTRPAARTSSDRRPPLSAAVGLPAVAAGDTDEAAEGEEEPVVLADTDDAAAPVADTDEAALAQDGTDTAEPSPVEQIVAACQERDGVGARRRFRALRGSEPRREALAGCQEYGIDLNADTAGPTAGEYLQMAEAAYAEGAIARAYLLARNSSRQERTTDALMLMGKAACDLGETDKVDHVHGMLMPKDKRKLQRYCVRKGVRVR